MQTIDLAVKYRTDLGKKGAKAVRNRQNVPGVIYGHGSEPVPFEVNERQLYKTLHNDAGANAILNLQVEGKELKETTCRFADIQHHPVTEKIQHLDLMLISLDEKIEVAVSVVLKNAEESIGAKAGGVIDVVIHEIEIECVATAIPEHISVDIKNLEIGDSLHVSDIQFPEGVECLLEPEDTIVAIHPPRVEEEVVEEDEEAPTGPEVIEKGKKEEPED